eukprot:GEMP01168435.1.p1 GENE.GEMP01168435.1~~GEMP01168435.1.p1  ORF type:complete len:106 (-),score=8.42 GEMP01168435.1:9-326(-)
MSPAKIRKFENMYFHIPLSFTGKTKIFLCLITDTGYNAPETHLRKSSNFVFSPSSRTTAPGFSFSTASQKSTSASLVRPKDISTGASSARSDVNNFSLSRGSYTI